MAEPVLILILAGIAISIAISYKTHLNTGIFSLFFAYLIGCFVLGVKPSEVIAQFPANIVFMLLSVSLLNGYAITNGTLQALTRHILYRSRKALWALPWILWLCSGALTLISQPNAVTIILCPIAFMLAAESGMSPYLAIIAVARGCLLGANAPIGQGSLVIRGIYDSIEAYSGISRTIVNCVYFNSVLTDFIIMLIAYIIFKGFKLRSVHIDKPERLGRTQRLTCIIMLGVLIAVFMPMLLYSMFRLPLFEYLSTMLEVPMVCIVAVMLCGLLRLGDEKKVIRDTVPWSTIILVIGICTLIGVAHEAGVVEYIGKWISNTFPAALIPLVLVFLAGVMSSFSGAISVVIPTLVPLVPSLAAGSGHSVVALTSCIFMGAMATTLSPFSSGGSCVLAACPDKALREKLFYRQLIMGGVIWAFTGFLSVLGVYELIA